MSFLCLNSGYTWHMCINKKILKKNSQEKIINQFSVQKSAKITETGKVLITVPSENGKANVTPGNILCVPKFK